MMLTHRGGGVLKLVVGECKGEGEFQGCGVLGSAVGESIGGRLT